jgi:hypothetical protein
LSDNRRIGLGKERPVGDEPVRIISKHPALGADSADRPVNLRGESGGEPGHGKRHGEYDSGAYYGNKELPITVYQIGERNPPHKPGV